MMKEFIYTAFIQFFFASFESGFRIFLRELDSSYHENFNSVRERLIKELCLNSGISSIELFQKIRNTIHNNGVFYHKNKTCNVTYKKKTYILEEGKPLGFLSFNLIVELIEDTLVVVDEITNHKKIMLIKEIKDPSVKLFAINEQCNIMKEDVL
ncbi:MAG: hypothetical protein WCP55_14470 [Lentisphaerota bacterium]